MASSSRSWLEAASMGRFSAGETVFVPSIGLCTVVQDYGDDSELWIEYFDPDGDSFIIALENRSEVHSTALVQYADTPEPAESPPVEAAIVPAVTAVPAVQFRDNTQGTYNLAVENIILDTFFNEDESMLNQWRPLRALGGNSIMLRRPPDGSKALPLIMFPSIEAAGLEVWFHSRWHGRCMQLTDVDAWDLCPAGQFWPVCLWCLRFHIPFECCCSHRSSNKHQRFHEMYIQPILNEEPGSFRRQELSRSLRLQTEDWAGATGDMVWTFL